MPLQIPEVLFKFYNNLHTSDVCASRLSGRGHPKKSHPIRTTSRLLTHSPTHGVRSSRTSRRLTHTHLVRVVMPLSHSGYRGVSRGVKQHTPCACLGLTAGKYAFLDGRIRVRTCARRVVLVHDSHTRHTTTRRTHIGNDGLTDDGLRDAYCLKCQVFHKIYLQNL